MILHSERQIKRGVCGLRLSRTTDDCCKYIFYMFQVASRQVFVVAGIIYILFGILGKFSAVFITIPYPVLGGAIILMWGTFFGVILSNLQVNVYT